jgi:hypothetical protein
MFQTWLRYAHAGRDRFDYGIEDRSLEEAPLRTLASNATGTQFHPRPCAARDLPDQPCQTRHQKS